MVMWDKAAILDQMCENFDVHNEESMTNNNTKPSMRHTDFDIIAETAKKINSGDLNVYDDSQVSWEEVTMFDLDKIKRLLVLIDTLLVEDTADAIINSIDGKYDSENPYYKPEVKSPYYDPSTAILWEQGDWHYENTIRNFVKQLIKKRLKKEEYQRKMATKKQERNKKNMPPSPVLSPIIIGKIKDTAQHKRELQEQKVISTNLSTSAQETDLNIENATLTCGPYKIAPKKKTSFASVIWILKELGYFIKQEDGSYATNRSDVIDRLLTTKGNADQLLPKALKTDTFMNVFREMLDKASEIYSKDKK